MLAMLYPRLYKAAGRTLRSDTMASIRLAPLRLRTPKALPSSSRTSIRQAHDLIIEHRNNPEQTPQPIIKYGPPTGGRSSQSGHTATVFGCTGFLGRYVVQRIARQGTQVVIPYRDENAKRFLKVTGDLGQIVPLEWDARSEEQIYECVKHSDVVYNLVGRSWETRNYSYTDVNIKLAERIARISAEANVPRLIHVSHLNANPNSTSEYYRTKYHGEVAVRQAFPTATIVRPASMYGHEDFLLHAAARYPQLFRLNGGNTRFLPVHVTDVAAALEVMINAPVTSEASTFVLPGPIAYSYNDILEAVSFFTMKPKASGMSIPKPIAVLMASVFNRALWWPTQSPDEIERRYIDDAGVEKFYPSTASDSRPSGWGDAVADNKVTGVNGEPVKTWGDLNIEPSLLEETAIRYLRNYRSSGNFNKPLEMGNFKAPKPYHVLP